MEVRITNLKISRGELDYIHLHGCEKRSVKGVVISGRDIRVQGYAWTKDVVVEGLSIFYGKKAMPIKHYSEGTFVKFCHSREYNLGLSRAKGVELSDRLSCSSFDTCK